MTYVKVNVNKPARQFAGKGGDKKDKIILVDIDDLLNEAQRDSKGVVIAGTHTFKAGAYALTLYVTPDSIAAKNNSEGEIDSEGIMQEIAFAHPGSSKEIRELRSNWLGRNALIFIEKCSDGSIDQYGAKCAPLRLSYEATDDKDVNRSVLTFKSVVKGPDVAIYEGTITFAEPAALVAANATSIDLSAGPGEYQLQANSGATVITTATNAVDNMVFTLLGSGGANAATITSANDFVLKNGTTWTGLANAQITFRAFKSGSSSWKFFEISRA